MINPLDKVNEVFASAMGAVSNVNRYGIKSCSIPVDPYFAHDLMELYKWYKEIDACSNETPTASCTGSQTCSLQSIEERIKTL